jgi:hypothetical protein
MGNGFGIASREGENMVQVLEGFFAVGLPLVIIIGIAPVLARREPSEPTRH